MINKRSLQNLNALMMLLAIDKYKSKRKAAEKTNTSIDTVNKYLRNLEQNLGLQLIINSTNGCKLTPRAQKMVMKLQDVTDALEQIYSQRPENNKYRGDVSIYLPLTASSNFLPDDIGNFFDSHPDVKINSITSIESPKYEESGADLAIVFAFDEKSKYYSLLYQRSVDLGVFAAPEYIKRYGYPKDMEDLVKNHRIANQIAEYGPVPEWNEIVQQAKHYNFASNSCYSTARIIKNGSGIGVMPRSKKYHNLVMLDNFPLRSKLNLYLIVNNNTKDIPRVKAVADYYRNLICKI